MNGARPERQKGDILSNIAIAIALLALFGLLVYGVLIATGFVRMFEIETMTGGGQTIGPGTEDPPAVTLEYPRPPAADLPEDFGGGMVPPNGSLPSSPVTPDATMKIATLTSDTSNQPLLRYRSFGDFNGTGWAEDDSLDNYGGNPLLLTSELLSLNKWMAIELYSSMMLTPYYSLVEGNYTQGQSYYVAYQSYDVVSDYLSSSRRISDHEGGKYEEAELSYRAFVYNTYLDTYDAETTQALLDFGESYGLSPDDPRLIVAILNCVKGALNYNLDMDWTDYDGGNMVLYMLNGDKKEGVCSHFATLGVLMYRAYGIPARYTIGAAGYTVAGQTVDVTADQLHAWVEIYLDGIGWVSVDVTGGGWTYPTQPVDPVDPVDPAEPTPYSPLDPTLPTGPVTSEEPEGVAVFYTDTTGQVLLAYRRYGVFDGTTWSRGEDELDHDPATTYRYPLEDTYYLLLKAGCVPATGQVSSTRVLYPGYNTRSGDGRRYFYISEDYSLSLFSTLTKYGASPNDSYMKYALAHYSDTLDEQTRQLLLNYAADHGVMGADDPIAALADCVRNALTYNEDFTWSDYTEGQSIVEYLLTGEKKEGICSHYATLGVLMFRAWGYPARYVTGYVADGVKGGAVMVMSDDAYAWIEVYVPEWGIWITLDVTGQSAAESLPLPPTGGSAPGTGTGSTAESGQPDPGKPDVCITTGSVSRPYDGTALTCDQFTVTGEGLYPGHRVALDPGGTLPYITYVGTIPNNLPLTILDEEGRDVSHQYDITRVWGELTVTQRSITVSSLNSTKFYDGTPLSLATAVIEQGQLAAGDTLSVWRAAQMVTPGRTDNVLELLITDAAGQNVTAQYDITTHWGQLTVTRAQLYIETPSIQKKYDGKPIEDSSYTLIYDGLTFECQAVEPVTLPSGDVLEVIMDGGTGSASPCSRPNQVDQVIVTTPEGEDVTSYYAIHITPGTLTIYIPPQ